MQKKILMGVLLLMIIPSLYAFFKLLLYSQEPSSIQQSSAIQIVSRGKNKKSYDSLTKNQKTSTLETKKSAVKTNSIESTDTKESKPVAPLEVLGTVNNPDGEGIANVLIYSNGEFPPTYTDANGQYHVVFHKSGATELLMNFSFNGYDRLKSLITIDTFKKSPVLMWDVTLTESLDTLSTTSFTGRVSNRVGVGLANQHIQLITLGDYSENEVRYIKVATTDENGVFTFNEVFINTKYQLVVLAGNGYASIEVNDLWITNDPPSLYLILEDIKLTNILGQVLDREGVPLANLNISAKTMLDNNSSNTISNSVSSSANDIETDKYNKDLVTDDSGVFQLENFPEGEVTFNIKSPTKIEISGVKLSEMDTQIITLTVDIGNHFLSGVVTDSDGQIIENAKVTMQSTYSKNGVNSHSVRSITTDSTGAFTFKNFSADEHIIIIVSKNFKQKMIVHQPLLSDSNLNIILERR